MSFRLLKLITNGISLLQKLHNKESTYPFLFNPNACGTCSGKCCNGTSGYIRISRKEMKETAEFLDLEMKKFIKTYLDKAGYHFYIKEIRSGDNFACIFFKQGEGCTVYLKRPRQCRTFPFWKEFRNHPEEAKSECPGVTLTEPEHLLTPSDL